jgi:hypothetical protein
MSKFYFTWGQSHKAIDGLPLKDYYCTVNADDITEAIDKFRKYNLILTGDGLKYSTCYDENTFDKSMFKNGEYREL